jgi:hypothetical protein
VSKSFPVAFIATHPRAELDAALLPVRDVLDHLPCAAIEIMERNDIRARVLDLGERYRYASDALQRLGVDVDAWPAPPAGLFVVEERTLYFRSKTPMTVAHELGHALDCALGGGVYRSSYDPDIRKAFNRATEFVTPYAAVGLDEFFAECFRAKIGLNDQQCLWPKVTRERLLHCAPDMAAWFDREIGHVENAVA